MGIDEQIQAIEHLIGNPEIRHRMLSCSPDLLNGLATDWEPDGYIKKVVSSYVEVEQLYATLDHNRLIEGINNHESYFFIIDPQTESQIAAKIRDAIYGKRDANHHVAYIALSHDHARQATPFLLQVMSNTINLDNEYIVSGLLDGA